MATIDILTRQDLMAFKQELINELKQMLSKGQAGQKKWLRTDEVRRLLKVSPGTMQTLRVNGTLPYSKIGGIIYYDYDHIQSLLTTQDKLNHKPSK